MIEEEQITASDHKDTNGAAPIADEEFLAVLNDAFGMLIGFWDWNERELSRENNVVHSSERSAT